MSEVLSEGSLTEPGSAPTTAVRVGVITTPTLASGAEERLARDLEAPAAQALSRRAVGAGAGAGEGLVEPPARLTDLVDAARAFLLARDWDLAVVVTEVPLRLGRRPMLSHASPTHGVALISLPALGVMHVGRRLRDAAGDAIAALIGDAPWEAGGGQPARHPPAAGGARQRRGRPGGWRHRVPAACAGREPAATDWDDPRQPSMATGRPARRCPRGCGRGLGPSRS